MKALTLNDCKVNDVLGVVYGDKTSERICRVVDKRDLEQQPLTLKTILRRPTIRRGQFLVTCQDTRGQLRSFYSGVEATARKIPALKVALLCLRRKLPRRKVVA